MKREITLSAHPENIPTVTDAVNVLLEAANCPLRAKLQIDIAIDELFSNIIHYAYGGGGGHITVRIAVSQSEHCAELTFIDWGAAFNPLQQQDPDISLPAEQRQLGGLGIFMVKESMDEVRYQYAEGENQLTIVKKW